MPLLSRPTMMTFTLCGLLKAPPIATPENKGEGGAGALKRLKINK